jgi:putative redox protein
MVYQNCAIAVHWEPRFCIHTGNCVRDLRRVFDRSSRRWLDVDAADADAIARTVLTCPTGALHFRGLDAGA